ncbi:hypothetical protein FRC04_007208 [Tulasnella sp. 424]|nr:hypothetical protein FRC04_007208 [Tulasnella sp. 424]
MLSVKDIVTLVKDFPALESLGIAQLQQFLCLARRLLPQVLENNRGLSQNHRPPLSHAMVEFMSDGLKMNASQVMTSWEAFFEVIIAASGSEDFGTIAFHESAFYAFSIAAETLPVELSACRVPTCQNSKLIYKPPINATLLTLHQDCHTRYYNNYMVTEASNAGSKRRYFGGGIPKYIEVADHVFVDLEFCHWVEIEMAFSQSSAENIARVYALTHSNMLVGSPALSKVTGETVLHAFFLHALLRDHHKRNTSLILPHHGENRARLSPALAKRNLRIAGTGQEMLAHACNLCMKIVDGPDGTKRG